MCHFKLNTLLLSEQLMFFLNKHVGSLLISESVLLEILWWSNDYHTRNHAKERVQFVTLSGAKPYFFGKNVILW